MGCVRPRQIFHPFYHKARFRPPSHHVVIAFISASNAAEEGLNPILSYRVPPVVASGTITCPRRKNPAAPGSAMRSVKKPDGSACLVLNEDSYVAPTTYVTSCAERRRSRTPVTASPDKGIGGVFNVGKRTEANGISARLIAYATRPRPHGSEFYDPG
jgi:hypothetical protein